jgi:hypothetical protein
LQIRILYFKNGHSRVGGFRKIHAMRPKPTSWAAAGLLVAMVAAGAVETRRSGDSLFRLPDDVGAPAVPRVLWLAIDTRAFPMRQNLTLYLTHPRVRREPVLAPSAAPDAPDNVATYLYGTVLHEGDKFRMWYYGLHATSSDGGIGTSPVSYAESLDGLNWNRPNLGQVTWRGSRANNLVAIGDLNEPGENGFVVDWKKIKGVSGSYVIRDDGEPQAVRRYKMIYEQKGLRAAVSPDGLRWTELPGTVLHGEPSSLYRYRGLYFVSTHGDGRGEGDREEGRQAYTWVSTDFEHWLPETVPAFKTPEPVVGSGWGTDAAGQWITPTGRGLYTQDHLGIGAVPLGNVVVGLYGMWNQRLPLWGEGGTDGDLGLVVSHDGFFFDEVVKGVPYLRSSESAADAVPGKKYSTILIQNNSILNVGAETWIYHSRWRNVELGVPAASSGVHRAPNYWGAIALARLPRDRWGALGLWGDKETGSAWTMPVTLPERSRLQINGAGLAGIRIEVADERFELLAGFERGQATGSGQDALDAEVDWGNHELSGLAGKTVRFHVIFARSPTINPRLFAATLLTNPR